ncbi:MAG TPA: glycosyltransferase family 39 protein [Gemmatimonadota bacterium]|nr:glycosyltransferase family 39 protein [Gemmatimonadota bacterium]
MSPSRPAQRLPHPLVAVLAAGLIARALVAVVTRSWEISPRRDFLAFGYEMGQIAGALASGHGFAWPPGTDWLWYEPGPTAWMPPLYPGLMALVFEGFGVFSAASAAVLITLQTAASLLTCVLLYIVGRPVFGRRAALLAALALALYPAAIHFSVQKFWSTTFFAACPLLLILALEQAARRPTLPAGLGVGLLFGLVALLDPVVLATVPFALVWLAWRSEGSGATRTRVPIAALAGLLVALSPWMVRNHAVFGRLVPVKSNFGNELFVGNNPFSVGDHRDVGLTLEHWDDLLTPAERARIGAGNEVERSALLGGKAVRYVAADPARFLRLSANRIFHYWSRPNPPGGWAERISELCWLAVLGVGILGLVTSDLRRTRVQLALLFLLTLPLPFYVTLVSHFRYRFVVEPLLLLFAAAAVVRFRDRLGGGRGIPRSRAA